MNKYINFKKLNTTQYLILTALALNFVWIAHGLIFSFKHIFTYSEFEKNDVIYGEFLYQKFIDGGRNTTSRSEVLDQQKGHHTQVFYGEWARKIDITEQFQAGYVLFELSLEEYPNFVFVRQGDNEILSLNEGLRRINSTSDSIKKMFYYSLVSLLTFLAILFIYQKFILKPSIHTRN